MFHRIEFWYVIFVYRANNHLQIERKRRRNGEPADVQMQRHFRFGEHWVDNPTNVAMHSRRCLAVQQSLLQWIVEVVLWRARRRVRRYGVRGRAAYMRAACIEQYIYLRNMVQCCFLSFKRLFSTPTSVHCCWRRCGRPGSWSRAISCAANTPTFR